MSKQRWDSWKQTQYERVLRTPPGEPVGPTPADILPPDEEMVPEEVGTLLGRYLLLLAQWSALTTRQTTHDREAARVKAEAQELRTAWEVLRLQYEGCLSALDTLTLPLESLLTVHLAQLGTPSPLTSTPLPKLLQQCLEHQQSQGERHEAAQ